MPRRKNVCTNARKKTTKIPLNFHLQIYIKKYKIILVIVNFAKTAFFTRISAAWDLNRAWALIGGHVLLPLLPKKVKENIHKI